ncbi:MAG: hypothetical protein LBT38_11135 [Deltaproteobacteria bacterium]|jgi:hypothetical protein|nr:hypothetical protein [Deltaproteobacteria bacterium]
MIVSVTEFKSEIDRYLELAGEEKEERISPFGTARRRDGLKNDPSPRGGLPRQE